MIRGDHILVAPTINSDLGHKWWFHKTQGINRHGDFFIQAKQQKAVSTARFLDGCPLPDSNWLYHTMWYLPGGGLDLVTPGASSALLLLKKLKLLYAMLPCKPFGTRLHKCYHCRCTQRFEKSHHESFCKRRKTITWYSTADTWRSSTHLQKNRHTRWCRV